MAFTEKQKRQQGAGVKGFQMQYYPLLTVRQKQGIVKEKAPEGYDTSSVRSYPYG